MLLFIIKNDSGFERKKKTTQNLTAAPKQAVQEDGKRNQQFLELKAALIVADRLSVF